jgi:hypothetical protein
MADRDPDRQQEERNPKPANPREHVREMEGHLREMGEYLRRMGERLRQLDEELRASVNRAHGRRDGRSSQR